MTQLCWECKAAQICLPGKLLCSNLVLETVLSLRRLWHSFPFSRVNKPRGRTDVHRESETTVGARNAGAKPEGGLDASLGLRKPPCPSLSFPTDTGVRPMFSSKGQRVFVKSSEEGRSRECQAIFIIGVREENTRKGDEASQTQVPINSL